MPGNIKVPDIIIILLFGFLMFDTFLSWNEYQACQYPIQIFLILTYVLIILYKIIIIIKSFFNPLSICQKILVNILAIGLNFAFLYDTAQGIIWQELNDEMTPNCVPEDRIPLQT